MSDEARERTGRTITFWMSHEEIDALTAAADRDGCSRNEAGRRAVRNYTEIIVGQPG